MDSETEQALEKLRADMYKVSAMVNFNRSAIQALLKFLAPQLSTLTRESQRELRQKWRATLQTVYEDEMARIKQADPALAEKLDLRLLEPELFRLLDDE